MRLEALDRLIRQDPRFTPTDKTQAEHDTHRLLKRFRKRKRR